MRESVSRIFRVIVTLTMAAIVSTSTIGSWAQDTVASKPTDVLIKLIETASGEGMFIGRDDYTEVRSSVASLNDALSKEKLTSEEADQVGGAIGLVEKRRAEWLLRLVDVVKKLRSLDAEALLSVDLARLQRVCGDDLGGEQTAIIIDSLRALAEGGSPTASQREALERYKDSTSDCETFIVSFLADISNYNQQLKAEIDALQNRVDEKRELCEGMAEGAGKEQCKTELSGLEDELKKKTETYRESKEVEASGKDFKILLAALAAIGGAVALYFGDAQTAAALFAASAELIKQANETEIEEFESQREAGVERDIDGAGTATPEQLAALDERAKNEGMQPVPFENSEGPYSVSIYQKPGEVDVYLSSVTRSDGSTGALAVAELKETNTDIADNTFNIKKLSELTVTVIRGSLFGSRNAVVMAGEASDATGAIYKISIAERSVGQRAYTITLDK